MKNQKLLRNFCEFLDKNIGLYYPKDRWPDLEKKLVLITNSFGFEEVELCLAWLMNSPLDKEKLDVLTSHLTIGETYFFRDKQLFKALETHIIPNILNRHHSDRCIRILSAGCSTGEEPYSLAILLHRLIPNLKKWKVSILGFDINEEFLNKAEKAQYKKWSFRTTPPEIKQSYFIQNKDDTYTLVPEIKKMVTFGHFNLVDDTYPNIVKGIFEIDLIFCRNVLIYFSDFQIKKTIRQLTKTLTLNGWLSVSAIEVPFIFESRLTPHSYPGVIFFKKEPSHKIEAGKENLNSKLLQQSIFLPKVQTSSIKLPSFIPEKDKEVILDKCIRLYQQKAYQEVVSVLHSHLLPYQNDPQALNTHINEVILLIRTYANQGNLNLALEWCEKALQADKLHPMLHYLNATLLQESGNVLEAAKSIKSALFIDSDFIMAYFVLGILEKQQGHQKIANKSFKTALELLESHSSENSILGAEEFTKDYLKDMIKTNLIKDEY